jgi:hypothetical protein
VLGQCPGFAKHRRDVGESLRGLGDEIVALELLRGVPPDLS